MLTLTTVEAVALQGARAVTEEEDAAWRAMMVQRVALMVKRMRAVMPVQFLDIESDDDASEAEPTPALSNGSSALSLLSNSSRSCSGSSGLLHVQLPAAEGPRKAAFTPTPLASPQWVSKVRNVLRARQADSLSRENTPDSCASPGLDRLGSSLSFGDFSSCSPLALRPCMRRPSTGDIVGSPPRQARRVRLSDAVTYTVLHIENEVDAADH